MKFKLMFSLTVAGMLILSCKSNPANDEMPVDQDQLISITHEQFETGKMSFGKMQRMSFDETVKCNGYIVSKPGGSAKISTSVSGLLQKFYCTPGQRVIAGQNLFELSGNEFIELQRDFAESASQLKRISSEYKRIKSLNNENIATEKELIFAESEFNTATASYSALKMKIKLIGLDPSRIENGNFYESFSIKSPLNGYVSDINLSLGQYADQQTVITEVFDVTRFHLKLAVFEKDINKISPGLKIKFRLLEDRNIDYSATVKSIGKNVDNDSKAILCYADIDDIQKANFVNNAFIEALIITKQDTVNSVAEEAIIKSGGNNYILVLSGNENDRYLLEKVKVELGCIFNGYAEILNQTSLPEILTNGAYNIPLD
jgi:cobalt-zinc-cadmium efflux system membrane fusion protein